jgi:hypothetical protein
MTSPRAGQNGQRSTANRRRRKNAHHAMNLRLSHFAWSRSFCRLLFVVRRFTDRALKSAARRLMTESRPAHTHKARTQPATTGVVDRHRLLSQRTVRGGIFSVSFTTSSPSEGPFLSLRWHRSAYSRKKDGWPRTCATGTCATAFRGRGGWPRTCATPSVPSAPTHAFKLPGLLAR